MLLQQRYFCKEIAKFNKNVFILANAVDPTEKQFTQI
jgi:hypothetical protein